MPTVDEEFHDAAMKFIDGAVGKKKPFFVWYNSTRMHVWTQLKKKSEGTTGIGLYPDGMVNEQRTAMGVGRSAQKKLKTDTAPRRSMARRGPLGKAAFGFPCSFVGPVPLSLERSITTSSPTRIGCRRSWQRRAILTSCRKWPRATGSATRPSSSISTGTILFPTSRGAPTKRRAMKSFISIRVAT